ncbi:putative integral membrane protein [Actinoplanes missouriensis 431]|uniref:Putative integral membrane protein n=1 Tax=Actinoplanes missouriensis (strain ATCC 14538 / DSM 43046 / CBS 188.64 / JCM 3121 / NBRC 102363 / NCIMB 12654 / NRRL B-3342 / UNCC 431) TaxID=512565 RepID=I0H9P2_ACTM4|nr:DUF389 domain-containing protein [Actinoplanes missouriensis]BAL89729.1 putative integral membrane protein [Actinoplanes missouriensis 431]
MARLKSPAWPGLRVPAGDVDRILSRLFLTHGDRRRNLANFWVLLTLAGVIAAAGVVADSTATVIGAMIVAPLMTPILGTALALVLADRRQLLYHLGVVLAGGAAVILIGYLLGLTVPTEVVASTNSQVASRVSPKLIDLLTALATGLVGGFALIRSDVSDTLPGVAIAISLVPPLAVVGLTAESGAYGQSGGALLLFGTNMAAIIATGTVIMLAGRVRDAAGEAGVAVRALGAKSLVTVGVALVLVAAPLGYGSWQVLQQQIIIANAHPVAQRWAAEEGWQLTDLQVQTGTLHVEAMGRPPVANEAALRADLDAAGLEDVNAVVTLVVGGSRELPAG